ncbi:MAG: hypothetical protein ED556_09025 [Winogradskyella sp.]|uniref:VOC family protein n=1 Tax=Winogradskyella sp. TaxID=1883156 RepID=UPI000F3E84DE|nr:VOC family protein [Winogradskyella sp.]RNC86422.1 MAG: hypothetical protein ED556_09025 [Winogradskyella sp.]
MTPNNIIFADLSTYTPKKSMAFYEHTFKWNYYESNDYYVAYLGNTQVTGLYETPDKFQQMGMPHFWMMYIQVSNVDATIRLAKQFGAIIEMSYELIGFGKVALLRDPLGAGFTIYEGDKLNNTRTKNTKNTLVWNELHVSNANAVIPFYEGIFNWKITETQDGLYPILNQEQEHIADILEISNQYKGKYEYWVCTFGVESLETTKNLILENDGNLINQEGSRALFTDNSGEAFFYIQEV